MIRKCVLQSFTQVDDVYFRRVRHSGIIPAVLVVLVCNTIPPSNITVLSLCRLHELPRLIFVCTIEKQARAIGERGYQAAGKKNSPGVIHRHRYHLLTVGRAIELLG